MSNPKTQRIAQFFVMLMAHIQIISEEGGIKDSDTVLHFMGSGASDTLTVTDIRDFLKEVTEKSKDGLNENTRRKI